MVAVVQHGHRVFGIIALENKKGSWKFYLFALFHMPEGFTRCSKVHDGCRRKSWAPWFESGRSSTSWIYSCWGLHEPKYVMMNYWCTVLNCSFFFPLCVFFFKMNSLRAAYRKIFMPSGENVSGFEERLAEVVSYLNSSLSPSLPPSIYLSQLHH